MQQLGLRLQDLSGPWAQSLVAADVASVFAPKHISGTDSRPGSCGNIHELTANTLRRRSGAGPTAQRTWRAGTPRHRQLPPSVSRARLLFPPRNSSNIPRARARSAAGSPLTGRRRSSYHLRGQGLSSGGSVWPRSTGRAVNVHSITLDRLLPGKSCFRCGSTGYPGRYGCLYFSSEGVHGLNQTMADAGIFVFFRCSAVVLSSVVWELVELSQAQ